MNLRRHLISLFLLSLSYSCSHETKEVSSITEKDKIPKEAYFVDNTQGDSLVTAVTIPADSSWPDLTRGIKPKMITTRAKPKAIPFQRNAYPVGDPKTIQVPKDLIKITPGENGVPLPEKVAAQPRIFPAELAKPTSASPLAFKDAATANIQYLGQEQGFTNDNVYSIFEDSHGHIWFGGGGAVRRYNGVSFTQFTFKGGIISGVWSIFEDKHGHFWFGTERNGLFCYDGVNVKHYTINEGISGNWVWSILEDKLGNLWFGTNGGVSLYKPDESGKSGTFTHFTSEQGLIGNNVRVLFEDSQDILWFGTNSGVSRYDPDEGEQGSFTNYSTREGLTANYITSIHEDRNRKMWFATGFDGNGVSYFDGMSFKNYTTNEGLGGNEVWCMEEDDQGNLWFGTSQGVSRYDPDTGTQGIFTHYTTEEGLSGNLVISMMKDSQGSLWFGMLPGGVSRYNSTSFSYYTNRNGLGGNAIRSMFIDSLENVWIGALPRGYTQIFLGDKGLKSSKFVQYSRDGGFPCSARSPLQDRRGNIWFGAGDGVIRFIPDEDGIEGSFTQFLMGEDSKSDYLPILEDNQGNIWIKGPTGVIRYDGVHFINLTVENGFLSSNIKSMFEDSKFNLWFATDEGISRYGAATFTHYTTADGLSSNLTSRLFEDSRGIIWISTNNGISCYISDGTESGGSITNLIKEKTLPGDLVRSVFEDSRRNIWILTNHGLVCFKPDLEIQGRIAGDFYTFNEENGLAGNNVKSILEDNRKNIWIGTSDGISLLALPNGEDSPSKVRPFQIFNFNRLNGLKHLVGPHVCLDRYNRIWWGGNEGLTMLDLNTFQMPKAYPARISINTIEIHQTFIDYQRLKDSTYSHSLTFGEDLLGSFDYVPAYYNYPVNLSLPHNLNHLTFQFSAIDWTAPNSIQYSHRMEGLDKNWSLSSLENKADYRSLAPGKYTFKVKAKSVAQGWSEPFEYTFTIMPPWWFTWWAYLLYILLVIFLLYRLYDYLLSRKLEHAEVKRLRELDTYKTRLYTNITHEFRTPLTIILGMASQIKDNPRRWYNEGLQMITRNGGQLLNLVNQMLDLSKLDQGKLKLKMQHGDVIGFLNYLVQTFESFAVSKNIQIHFLKEINQLEMDFDPDQLTKVVSNVLSNAVKYTPKGGHVYVTMRTYGTQTSEILEIRIKDTGSGIPAKDLPQIFDRFYQVDDSATRKAAGTGIGLTLVNELVQLMGGEINVKSNFGEGLDFSVMLPVNCLAPKFDPNVAMEDRMALMDVSAGEIVLAKGEEATGNIPSSEGEHEETSGAVSQKKDLLVVLLIEDNRDVLTYLASCLEADYQIEFAMNGQEGIDQALEIVPDIIISDIMMPEKDGYEVCNTLKGDIRTSHIPIILLTAKADQDAKLEGLKSGADAYLSKPFDKKELTIRLENLLELRRKMQARYSKPEADNQGEKHSLTREQQFLKDLRQTMGANLSDEGFGIAQLCRKMGMSRSQLHNKLKALTGQSASIFIRKIRVGKAKNLLRGSDLNVSQVAYEVGFRTPVYFTQVFTEEVGVSPSRFRGSMV